MSIEKQIDKQAVEEMGYIVPRKMPTTCHECQFHYCTEYHPFWSGDKEKRNTQTIRCQAAEPFRSTVLDINDKTFKPDWCPLRDAKGYRKQSEGEWTISKIGDGGKIRTCSNCHISQTVNVYKNKVMFAYCPYCGAKMKGGAE